MEFLLKVRHCLFFPQLLISHVLNHLVYLFLQTILVSDIPPTDVKQRHTYYGQIQLGLEILGLKTCDLVVHALFDKSQLIIRVQRNENFITDLLPFK
ncbi:hypothetical protein B566_EDAN016286 [Ephemera danica]|nr:hypothetical protein B566_EDAN016286 [Ephemera danica]